MGKDERTDGTKRGKEMVIEEVIRVNVLVMNHKKNIYRNQSSIGEREGGVIKI
jgi:hypothetical protein